MTKEIYSFWFFIFVLLPEENLTAGQTMLFVKRHHRDLTLYPPWCVNPSTSMGRGATVRRNFINSWQHCIGWSDR